MGKIIDMRGYYWSGAIQEIFQKCSSVNIGPDMTFWSFCRFRIWQEVNGRKYSFQKKTETTGRLIEVWRFQCAWFYSPRTKTTPDITITNTLCRSLYCSIVSLIFHNKVSLKILPTLHTPPITPIMNSFILLATKNSSLFWFCQMSPCPHAK